MNNNKTTKEWKQMQLRLEAALFNELDEVSHKIGINRTQLIRKSITQYLQFLDTGSITSLLNCTE